LQYNKEKAEEYRRNKINREKTGRCKTKAKHKTTYTRSEIEKKRKMNVAPG
jgi:hypothetical protein